MPNTKELQPDKLSAIVIGDPKSGKTRFAGTWPNPFLFSFDRGMSSLAGQDIEYEVYYDEERRKPNAYQRFDKDFKQLIFDIKAGKKHFRTIILDNLTFLCRWVINDIRHTNNLYDKPLGYEGYGSLKSKLQDVIGLSKLAGIHVVATAESKLEKDELTGELETWPAIEGSYREDIVADFDMAFFMKVGKDLATKKPKFQLQTVPDHRIKCAGSRWDCGLEPLEEPNYKAIMEKIKTRFPSVTIVE